MKTLCRISARYYDENGRRKGNQEFTILVDPNEIAFMPDEVAQQLFQDLLNAKWKMDGWCGRVVYLSHEIVFSNPISLDDQFEIDKFIAESYAKAN